MHGPLHGARLHITSTMSKTLVKFFKDPEALSFFGLVLLGGILAAMLAVTNWILALGLAMMLTALTLFAWKPVVGVYAIAVLYPFINFQFVFGELNVPYVDLVAMLAFAGWFLRAIWLWVFQGQAMTWKQFPGLGFFIAFVLASFLSITNAEDIAASIKYVLRPLSFFYLMFVIFPLNNIRTPRILLRVFYIFYGIGIFTALNGLWGFLTYPAVSVLQKRAVPADILGIFPFGTSHNLVAEVLVSVIPIGLLLVWLNQKEWNRKLLFLGTLFMFGVNLLTFSRTGWIAALCELLIFGVLMYRHQLKQMARGLFVVGALFTPILIYMFVFSSQSFVQSSDENRKILNEIAYTTWRDFPILGAGPGRFQEFVGKNTVYIIEFGDASEAHGFVQKIAAEEGVLGLTTYVLLLGYVLYVVWKTYQQVKRAERWNLIILACFAMAAGSIVFQLFQTNYFVSKLWFPLGLALTAATLAKRELKIR